MKLKGLTIGYHNSVPIVSSIDAELNHGQFCCLIGRNGTGKSTLLKTIAGIQSPLSGSIETPSNVAIVLTQVPELKNTTVRDMVAYGRLGTTGLLGRLKEIDYQAADKAIEQVGICFLSNRQLNSLSDGEKQKTMIARAIAQEAPILLLDEPAAFLDYPSRRELMLMLQKLAHEQQQEILLSTHDVELASEFADCLWVIADNRLEIKTPQDFHPEEL